MYRVITIKQIKYILFLHESNPFIILHKKILDK